MSIHKFSRRQFLHWSALMAGSAALAACAAPSPGTANSTESTQPVKETEPTKSSPPADDQMTVEYFTYDLGQANQSREDMFAVFTQMNPSIAVKNTVLPYGENWQKLAALIAAKTPPDVIYGDFSLLRHALVGELLDLSEYFNLDPVLGDKTKFTIDMQDAVQAKFGTEKIYNLIVGTWVPILYYNKDVFDAAGEAYPDENWTWDKVRAVAKKLTKPEEKQYGFQFGTTLDTIGWLWWESKPQDFWAIPQVFPEKTGFDNDTGQRVFSLYAGFGVEDQSMMPFSEAGSYQQYGAAFGAGKAAMYNGGDWDAGWGFKELPFKWDMTFTPKLLADYRPSLNTMVATSAIAAGIKNPDAAWKLAHFISTSREGQKFIGQGAYETPVLREIANSSEVLNPEWAVPGYNIRVKSAELDGPMYTPYQLSLNLWEFNDKYLFPAVEGVTTGSLSVNDALASLDKDGKPYFEQLNKELQSLRK